MSSKFRQPPPRIGWKAWGCVNDRTGDFFTETFSSRARAMAYCPARILGAHEYDRYDTVSERWACCYRKGWRMIRVETYRLDL